MRSTKVRMLAITALAIALAAWPTPPHAEAVASRAWQESDRQLVWDSFIVQGEDFDRYRLSDRDVISVRFHSLSKNPYRGPRAVESSGLTTGVPAHQVEIVLISGRNVTWWKGITAFKNAPLRRPGSPRENWVRLAHVDTQDDDHGPDKMLLDVADLRDGLKLSFEKAKAFGAHTPMYTFSVPNPQQLGGSRIIFTWEIDG